MSKPNKRRKVMEMKEEEPEQVVKAGQSEGVKLFICLRVLKCTRVFENVTRSHSMLCLG